ncbi:MAG: dihydrodipicolinate synthase family protein, partial [Pirellulales bacterium]|nr:dihydrodipicolinate synthase family protein [Pirellulales bacterium]
TLPLMSVGAQGVISVVGNIVPEDMISLIAAVNSGDLAEAQRWHHKLFPLCRDMLGLSTNPSPVKAAMKIMGRDTGEMRLPMTPLNEEEVLLQKTLAEYGLGQQVAV